MKNQAELSDYHFCKYTYFKNFPGTEKAACTGLYYSEAIPTFTDILKVLQQKNPTAEIKITSKIVMSLMDFKNYFGKPYDEIDDV